MQQFFGLCFSDSTASTYLEIREYSQNGRYIYSALRLSDWRELHLQWARPDSTKRMYIYCTGVFVRGHLGAELKDICLCSDCAEMVMRSSCSGLCQYATEEMLESAGMRIRG